MRKDVQIEFSDQAKTLLASIDASKEDVADFLAEKQGFTVGGSEVVQYLEQR